MCDPVSIGLTLAGTALQTVGQQQAAHAEKQSIYKSGQDYKGYLADSGANFGANRQVQNDAFAKNQGTVADTLATYSQPNQQKLLDDATAKRQASYVSPLNSMSFAAPVSSSIAPSSAVAQRNAATGDAAKSRSIGEALSKGALDAYGDARLVSNTAGANNAANINITDQDAARSGRVSQAQQGVYDTTIGVKQNNVLPAQLALDSTAGNVAGGFGDLFSAAGALYGLSGGITGSSMLGKLTGSNAAGYGGLFGASAPKVGANLISSPMFAI